jgi:hypothetical protein
MGCSGRGRKRPGEKMWPGRGVRVLFLKPFLLIFENCFEFKKNKPETKLDLK